ncbi:MAG: OmpA family protein [Bacteroidales bacterium]|nr:OmpA family protein [Bacteroidales bacterium]MDY2915835.1 OmpA family protein [Alloprevotella sp.]MCI7613749.1 OmpA family protein [Bacteroidales bacterium]MDY4460401.1 OmpA family protein [Alloprevotella sp.]MDY4739783.1 OmpA family protein [Alloprevotella sp.]
MKLSPLYILLIFILLSACGTPERSIKRGDAAMAIGEYCEAAAQYKKGYSRIPPTDRKRRGEVAYKMGDAFRRYGNTARALGAFRNAARYGQNDTLTQFYIGELLRMQGDYRGAEKAYQTYLDSFPSDERARQMLQSLSEATGIKERGSAYTVKMETMFSGSRSDYAPAYNGDEATTLYFSTTRPAVTGSDLSGITGMKPGDIYMVRKDEKGKWKSPEPVEGGLNTENDEGATAFSSDGKTMYLTVCRTDPQYPRMAEIWTSQRADAGWGKPAALKITADTLSSYAHPAPSPDGRWLYFTSDMPGGYGGTDLWRARMDAHGVGSIENLGPEINTEGNECFPAFRPSGELYFSSDGRTPSLGGLDLYRAKQDTITEHWTVVHLPAPMNSPADDFGITFEGWHNRGYFSSNRSTGGRGWDKIYSFSYPEVLQTVKGWVYEQDGYELPEALVYIVGNDGTNEKLSVKSDGSFEMAVTPGVDYLLLATCKGYLNFRNNLHADSLEVEHQHVLQFPLPSINVPVLVRNVFYEFDKADLTPESTAALDRLTNMLKENPNVTIELAAHCDYRGNDDYNLRLSQRRAESVVRYLTEHGIEAERLTAKGYGETVPKIVNKKLLETYPFLHEGDTLTVPYILALPADQQEVCNALNRRTEFRVLRTTYGLFDEHGNLLLKPEGKKEEE